MEKQKETERGIKENYKTIGNIIGASLGEGIKESAEDAKKAADLLHQRLLDSQTMYLKTKERLKQLENEAMAEQYRQREEKLSAHTEIQSETEARGQSERLRLQEEGNREYFTAFTEHLQALENQVRVQKEKVIYEFDQIARRASDSLSELEQSRRKMESKMLDYGELYDVEKVIFRNVDPSGKPIYFEKLILDLEETKNTLETYAGLLETVQSMEEIPSSMFAEIRNLSIEDAIRFQEALLAMGTAERTEYFQDWEAINTLSSQTAQNSFAAETQRILTEIEQELSEWYGTIPAEFFIEGELSAKSFGSGFLKKMKDLKAELQEAVLSVSTVASSGTYNPEFVVEPDGGRETAYSVTYVLNSAGETVAEQLRSAKSHADILKLRGE
ncbi:MAG: hypothetical protein IJF61_04660 [Clostridia bacterium]|nr:hypothetical protein [Clostridia bacterium]